MQVRRGVVVNLNKPYVGMDTATSKVRTSLTWHKPLVIFSNYTWGDWWSLARQKTTSQRKNKSVKHGKRGMRACLPSMIEQRRDLALIENIIDLLNWNWSDSNADGGALCINQFI